MKISSASSNFDQSRYCPHRWQYPWYSRSMQTSHLGQTMPRTKGSKNRVTASTDFDAQIAKLQKDKAMLEEGLSKTVAHIEELKTDF